MSISGTVFSARFRLLPWIFFFYFVPPSRQEVADMLAGVSHASDVWVERKVRRTEQEQLSDPPKNLITLSPPTFYCHECLPCEYWYTAPVWKCTLIKRIFCQTLITAYTKRSIHLNDELDPRCQTKCICLLWQKLHTTTVNSRQLIVVNW